LHLGQAFALARWRFGALLQISGKYFNLTVLSARGRTSLLPTGFMDLKET
jgi:hypothetical protein